MTTQQLWSQALQANPVDTVHTLEDFKVYGPTNQWPQPVRTMFRNELRAIIRANRPTQASYLWSHS